MHMHIVAQRMLDLSEMWDLHKSSLALKMALVYSPHQGDSQRPSLPAAGFPVEPGPTEHRGGESGADCGLVSESAAVLSRRLWLLHSQEWQTLRSGLILHPSNAADESPTWGQSALPAQASPQSMRALAAGLSKALSGTDIYSFSIPS